jgi:hypothetical protein
MMISAEELVRHVSHGRDIDVRRTETRRIVVVKGRHRKKPYQSYQMSLEEYDHLMQATVEALAGKQDKNFRIDISYEGYYGDMCCTVRSGFFGQRKSQLNISPRHLANLSSKLGLPLSSGEPSALSGC